jgi:thiosulfate dehydrogenase
MANPDSHKTFDPQEQARLLRVVKLLIGLVYLLLAAVALTPVLMWKGDRIVAFFTPKAKEAKQQATGSTDTVQYWIAADLFEEADTAKRRELEYGKELIAHTAQYLGPKGSVMAMSNGLNCQNCHLDAGTRVFGNNYGSVASTYPKFRARSGSVESVFKRVNDCFERSLNGSTLDSNNREMKAMIAYIEFIGKNVPKGQKAAGSGLKELAFLDRAADPERGRVVYEGKCQSCHQPKGEGQLQPDGIAYSFPPLWGPNSYNDGAGLFRLSNFAKYVKYNMPQGVHFDAPQLSDEEAWDVAAFVNSQPRPHKATPNDWPDISKKPIDHPFGPYADQFSEQQHKFGPFKPIEAFRKKNETLKKNS